MVPSNDPKENNEVRPSGLRIPRLLRNKFLVASVAFAAIMLFLDKNDLFTRLDRDRELESLKQSKEYYIRQIASKRAELEALKNNPAILEKYAREKYLMKRDNEDLFIIQEKPAPGK